MAAIRSTTRTFPLSVPELPMILPGAMMDFRLSPPRKPNAPEGQQQPPSPFPYVKNSPVYRDFHKRDRVTVFLYEYVAEYDPPSNPMVQSAGARTNNRYTLFFQFDTFDPTRGKVKFNLNNIQANRNLADLTDPFSFWTTCLNISQIPLVQMAV